MRRSHAETSELVAARVQDFLDGQASDAVLKASLKALGLDTSEIEFEYWRASQEKARCTKPTG